MDHTNTDGQNPSLAEFDAEAVPAESTGQAEPGEAGKVDAPFHGFDGEGEYFIVRVHKSFGYIFILGWLLKASDWLKMHVAMQVKQQRESQLIKPKGFRGFNPFGKK